MNFLCFKNNSNFTKKKLKFKSRQKSNFNNKKFNYTIETRATL